MSNKKPSYDAADFDPTREHPRVEPKRCKQCSRVFLNRWVFLRHRPEGRAAITEPADPTVPCYSDRQLERLGMWQVRGIWQDSGKVSPLDEVPGVARARGKGRTFQEGNRYGAHAQQRRKRERRS
jgi:hypothetical protein